MSLSEGETSYICIHGARHVKITFLVSLRDLYVLSFSMRKDILYEGVKKFVKTRKEDLNAYFTAS